MLMATESPDVEALYERNTWHGPVPERKAPVEPTRYPLAGNKPGVRSTSRKALKTVDLGPRQAQVLVALQMHDHAMCDLELLAYLGRSTANEWRINTVTGRRNDPLKAGRFEEKALYACAYSPAGVSHV